GIVAEIALALGRASIDIVDMGLYPSSGTHGTVCLWLRGGEVTVQAEELVRGPGLEAARAGGAASIRWGRCAGRCRRRGTSRCRTGRRCWGRCAPTPCT